MGIAIGVIGTGLAFFNAITPETLTEISLIIFGIALIGAYCKLSWDGFKEYLGNEATIGLLTPPLLTFGILAIYTSFTAEWLVPPHGNVLLGFGAAIILIPIALIMVSFKK